MQVTVVPQITIFMTDRPGELARAETALADAGVNIRALSATPVASDHATAHLVVDNASLACTALAPVTLAVRTVDVLFIQMPDRPRALLEVTQCLADAGVNIKHVYGSVTDPGLPAPAVFNVSDLEAAQKALAAM